MQKLRRNRWRTGVALGLVALALSACGGQAFEPHPVQEIPPGPGLLTGQAGKFYLLGEPAPQPDESEAPVE